MFFLKNSNKSANDLLISCAFPPQSDTSGLVMSKRIISENLFVDVIQNDGGNNYEFNEYLDNYIDNRYILDIKGKENSIDFIFEFVEKGLEALNESGKHYDNVISRAQFMCNHFLGFEYKIINPDINWEAEFSDPIELSIYSGKQKTSKEFIIDNKDYIDKINSQIIQFNKKNNSNLKLLENPNHMAHLIEYITFIFADTIIFTNENQREVMLDGFSEELKEIVLNKSEIKPHPTLESKFYNIKNVEIDMDENYINLAYFGSYYYVRHFESLFYAFESLNHKYKDKLRFHFFTDYDDFLNIVINDLTIKDSIVIHKPLGFFDFLNATQKFDILIINDTVTENTFKINPFLPSKYSDYIGSTSDIWTIYEDGSPVSKLDAKYKSSMNDYKTSCDVLINILKEYGYDDPDYSFSDNFYEKRINQLNFISGREYDKKEKYFKKVKELKKQNRELKKEISHLREENKRITSSTKGENYKNPLRKLNSIFK